MCIYFNIRSILCIFLILLLEFAKRYVLDFSRTLDPGAVLGTSTFNPFYPMA